MHNLFYWFSGAVQHFMMIYCKECCQIVDRENAMHRHKSIWNMYTNVYASKYEQALIDKIRKQKKTSDEQKLSVNIHRVEYMHTCPRGRVIITIDQHTIVRRLFWWLPRNQQKIGKHFLN